MTGIVGSTSIVFPSLTGYPCFCHEEDVTSCNVTLVFEEKQCLGVSSRAVTERAKFGLKITQATGSTFIS